MRVASQHTLHKNTVIQRSLLVEGSTSARCLNSIDSHDGHRLCEHVTCVCARACVRVRFLGCAVRRAVGLICMLSLARSLSLSLSLSFSLSLSPGLRLSFRRVHRLAAAVRSPRGGGLPSNSPLTLVFTAQRDTLRVLPLPPPRCGTSLSLSLSLSLSAPSQIAIVVAMLVSTS